MRTLVLGLGNPILTDDSVGVRVAEEVRAALAPRPEAPVVVETASVGGLALMEMLIGYDRAILIDALCRGDQAPGSLLRLTLRDVQALSPTERSVSPHDTSLGVALDLGQQMGLPLPAEIVIYAITVTEVLDFGEEPTPPVAAAIPAAVDAVLAEVLARGGVEVSRC
ncbi:MAG: hydrogenase maturation protease [Chloroflexaceae bacterium]